jgi:hypothetical protein
MMTAVPVAGLTEPDALNPPPLVNVTVPVVPIGRVAVMVTEAPKVLGPEVATAMLGVVLLTTCTILAVAVLLFESPL